MKTSASTSFGTLGAVLGCGAATPASSSLSSTSDPVLAVALDGTSWTLALPAETPVGRDADGWFEVATEPPLKLSLDAEFGSLAEGERWMRTLGPPEQELVVSQEDGVTLALVGRYLDEAAVEPAFVFGLVVRRGQPSITCRFTIRYPRGAPLPSWAAPLAACRSIEPAPRS